MARAPRAGEQRDTGDDPLHSHPEIMPYHPCGGKRGEAGAPHHRNVVSLAQWVATSAIAPSAEVHYRREIAYREPSS
jgi:hypothetical protein